MGVAEHFEAFLDSTVNLQQWRLNQLDGRVDSIVSALQRDSKVGPAYKEHIPQGSWAHQTIIRPVGEFDEFDADFLLHLEADVDWANEPRDYLKTVRAALRSNSVYKEKVRKKNRCVRVGYANDCHVDIVPHLTLEDDRQVIVNYATNEYEDTNPAGFTEWMQERDDITKGNLRRVIRLVKYLRDYKNTFSCPSVILTTLLGSRVQNFDTDTRYADVPTTMVSMLEDLDAWLKLYPLMPLIDDPSCPGTSFNHRWSQDKYSNFKSKISLYASWARNAADADDDSAVPLWQKLFGPEFTAPAVEEAKLRASLTESGVRTAADTQTKSVTIRAPREEFIEERGYGFQPRYSARIDGRIEELGGFRARPIRVHRVVRPGMKLRFKLITDAPQPFNVLWKVRNRGPEAANVDDLRGRIQVGEPGSLIHREAAKYRGQHYVEAYVVKNGIVVASDHHEVHIV